MLPFIKNLKKDGVLLPAQIPDHTKCGEVYTWQCNGEFYAVECTLCEDRPLCPLSEFPQHMEVWHTDWEEHNENDSMSDEQQEEFEDDDDEDDNEEDASLSFITEDSGLYEQDHLDDVEILEPFEQVLIEEDDTVMSSVQIKEDVIADSDEIDVNDVYIKENKSAQLQQAELKNEITFEQVEQHKQNSTTNKTITENYNKNSFKQKNENKLNEQHQLQIQLEETIGRELNKEFKESITDLFTTQHIKSNCTKVYKREYLKRILRDSHKTRNSYIENENFLTVTTNFKEKIRNSRAKENLLIKNENILQDTLAETSSIDFEQSSETAKGRDLSDSKSNIRNTTDLSDLQQTLLENESFTDEMSNRDDFKEILCEDEGPKQKLSHSIQCNQSSIDNHSLVEKTKESLKQKVRASSDLNDNVANNFAEFEEILTQCLIDPNELTQNSLDSDNIVENTHKLKSLEAYMSLYKTFTQEITNLTDIEENFPDFEKFTENLNTSKDSEGCYSFKNQTLMEKFNNSADKEGNSMDFEIISESKSTNSRGLIECYLENKIIESDFNEQSFPRNKDLLHAWQENSSESYASESVERSIKYENLSGEVKNSILQNSIQELTISNDLVESAAYQKSTVTEILDSRTHFSEIFKNLESSQVKLDSKTPERITKGQNSFEEGEHKTDETGSGSQFENKSKRNEQSLKDYLDIAIIKQGEPAGNRKSENNIKITHKKEIILNQNFSNNGVNSSQGDSGADVNCNKKLRKHLKTNTTTCKAFLRSAKKNRNLRHSLLPNKKIRFGYPTTKEKIKKQFKHSREEISVVNRKAKSIHQKTRKKLYKKSSRGCQVSKSIQLLKNSSQVSDVTSDIPSDKSLKKTKQTRVTEYFKNPNTNTTTEHTDKPQSENCNSTLNSMDPVISSSPQIDKTEEPKSVDCSSESSSLSPKTEEEHFEFYEPKEKLTRHHIIHLIELYKKHPRLWDQSHPDYCEPHLCRKSWQEITQLWNDYCKRNFTIAEVRIRICTLCQRYLQERERLVLEGELDEFAKFPYYEQMRFLEQQKSLQKRKDLYDQQNEKILEIYEHFPVLWHISCYKLRQAKERSNAFQSISTALKLCGIYLSAVGVQKRIRSLKKCYRLEKIRYLHAQVEQTPFESSFKHFERMKFLDKHIDPFVCRICSKIFENITGFKEHLEAENHGNILQEDTESDGERLESEKELEKTKDENFNEDSKLVFENEKNTPDYFAENNKPIIQEVLIFPPNSAEATVLTNFPIEDQIIEEIIENVSNTESVNSQTLDNFSSCEEICVNKSSIEESFHSMNLDNELNIQRETLKSSTCKYPTAKQDLKVTVENKKTAEATPEPDSSNSLVVKVQCADYALDLKLDAQQETSKDCDNRIQTALDTFSTPLPYDEICKMIELYRKFPQLWNPNHLDYNSRNSRRQAWLTLTAEFCKAVGKQFSWRTLHRKLTDYAKYYKKLNMENEDYETATTKWTFFDNFKFLQDVIAVHDELQRSVHHRDNNFKIIAIYETLPQLWNIKHPDFNKRCFKQRNIEIMCNRLQEENNFQITIERLKNRLIELRAQYRAVKKQRVKCEKNQQNFVTDFEFYEALIFLDEHIDPFICKLCKMEFKKLTDYNHHQKKEHERKKTLRNSPLSMIPPSETEQDVLLGNVCHICGIKFTTRSNLVHHVKRHQGIRNYPCTMCPKKFFASHSLKVHIRTHTKECPYTCEKCGMSFVSASKLNQHVKRHTDKRDFSCNYCSKAFYTAFERDRHVRRHLNIRDKACSICGKTFVAGSSYYAHMMLHSDTKRFKCDRCDMKFSQYAGLYKHKKKHTGVEETK